MNIENPLVSIIVRTKDRPKLLKRALQSVAAQTYRPIEVVLVNDGGCDLDVEELKHILGDVSLNYIRLQENKGRAHAGNVGIENAKGDYIGFLDDDDIYHQFATQSLIDAAQTNGNKVIYGKVICRTYVTGNNIEKANENILGEPFNFGKLIFENFIPINSILIPRVFFLKVGKFDNVFEIYEDWDMLIRLAEVYEFHHIDTIVAEYSIHGSATITGKGGATMQNYYREKFLEKHFRKVPAKDFLLYLQSVIDRIVIAKEEKIQEQDGKIQEQEGKIQEQEGKIQELLSALEDKEPLIAKLQEGIELRDDKIKRLNLQEQKLKKIVEDILSSDSWKITRPLRMVGSAFKKTLSRLRA